MFQPTSPLLSPEAKAVPTVSNRAKDSTAGDDGSLQVAFHSLVQNRLTDQPNIVPPFADAGDTPHADPVDVMASVGLPAGETMDSRRNLQIGQHEAVSGVTEALGERSLQATTTENLPIPENESLLPDELASVSEALNESSVAESRSETFEANEALEASVPSEDTGASTLNAETKVLQQTNDEPNDGEDQHAVVAGTTGSRASLSSNQTSADDSAPSDSSAARQEPSITAETFDEVDSDHAPSASLLALGEELPDEGSSCGRTELSVEEVQEARPVPADSSAYVVELESETAGRVVLRVQDSAEGVRARIIASNDTGYRIIHSEMDNVRQVVEQSGIGLADLSLGQHGEGPQQESQSGNRADRRPVVTEPELQSELTNRFPADNGLNVLV